MVLRGQRERRVQPATTGLTGEVVRAQSPSYPPSQTCQGRRSVIPLFTPGAVCKFMMAYYYFSSTWWDYYSVNNCHCKLFAVFCAPSICKAASPFPVPTRQSSTGASLRPLPRYHVSFLGWL